jgi:multidrug resistance efflux pump
VGTELRSEAIPARGANLEFDGELDRYRQNVEQLRKLLPSIQGQLLAQRARIESQRARIESAAHWARASRQTL